MAKLINKEFKLRKTNKKKFNIKNEDGTGHTLNVTCTVTVILVLNAPFKFILAYQWKCESLSVERC